MSDMQWTVLCTTAEVLPGERHVAWLGDTPVLVVNHDGDFYALEDRCSHEDFELSPGPYDADAGTIECVLHGARFDVRTGEPLCPPAYSAVQTFPVMVQDGLIYVSDPR
ncbi:Rieske 2Fe-2S domain-containing protein [Chiayiivirga flava]|uniref:3-phenylpropionate/trans-cinnamate dioxygenase ferredoxin subunit n=1 Tax=Chiayiivirga flava TaxID=659595 RepID=A0A7W8D3I8_9GAMM|nr:3-phenylpropionate/trans-cinnamate dioxygenase ferredoxin subunit [Chiayiivirga flava]